MLEDINFVERSAQTGLNMLCVEFVPVCNIVPSTGVYPASGCGDFSDCSGYADRKIVAIDSVGAPRRLLMYSPIYGLRFAEGVLQVPLCALRSAVLQENSGLKTSLSSGYL